MIKEAGTLFQADDFAALIQFATRIGIWTLISNALGEAQGKSCMCGAFYGLCQNRPLTKQRKA